MTCDSESQSFAVTLSLPEIVRDESEVPSFDVDLNLPEIVCEDSKTNSLVSLSEADIGKELPAGVDYSNFRDPKVSYTREHLLSLAEVNVCGELPHGFDQSIVRDLRVSYTREHLFSLAKVNVCKELPHGFDWSIISDLQDAFKSPPSAHEQQRLESVSAGGLRGVSNQEYHERWVSLKPSTTDHTYKSAPENPKLQGHDSLSVGRMFRPSTEESAERWDNFKLNNADSKSTVSEKFSWHEIRRPWVNPTTTSNSRNASQNRERSGILGSWSGTKPSPGGSEMSILKLPGSDNSLSRCSQPYRPPSYFKAMSHPETPKHDSHSNNTFDHAERPNKQRATEESWRKDSYEIKTNEPLQAIEKKQISSEGDEKAIPQSAACTPLEKHLALQVVDRFKVAPTILPSVSTLAKLPCSTPGTTDNCLTEDSVNDQPLLQEEVTYHVENLQPQIEEGGRFSALIILEDAEDLDPDLIDEAYAASNVKPRDDQRIIEGNVGFSKTQKKGLRTQVAPVAKNTDKITSSIFPNNIVEIDNKSSAVKASVSSSVFVKPSSNTSNSQGGFVTQNQKGIAIASNNLQKDFAKKTFNADNSATEAKVFNGSLSESWLSSHRAKNQNITMDSRDSCKPVSKSVHWNSNNDKAPSKFSSWPDLSHNNIWRASTGMSTKENLLDQGKSKETSFYAQEGPKIEEGLKFNPLSRFDNEADSNFEINLPDEDSLITIDDTYIFQEQMLNKSHKIPLKGGRTVSPVSCLNKPMQTSLHRNLALPDPSLHDTPLNLAKLFVNPSNTQADLRSPPQWQDPWKFYHHDYGLFPADAVSVGQLPLTPKIYEPSLWDNHSSKVPQSHTFYPHLENNLPADLPRYYQVHQMPWGQKKSDLLGSHPLNYQGGNVNSTNMGMRGRHGEEDIRPTFSQILQMQIEMAQAKLNSVAGFKPREYSKPISNSHR